MAGIQENKPRGQRRKRKGYAPLSFILVCAAVILCVSFLFRVKTIEVIGSTVYPDEEIILASGIQEGDNLFFINRSSAASRIISKLPAVDNAVVDRVMPNRIRITIKESASIAYIDIQGDLWSLDHSMRFLEEITDSDTEGKIEIKGVDVTNPIAGTKVDSTRTNDISAVLNEMVNFNLLSDITWLDMSSDETVEFDYLDRFTVRMPIEGDLEYNFEKLLAAVNQLSPSDRALLDLSIDDKVHFSPR
ncbi:MAG: cell division protein FtsQ/DivIB [Oscillospiraceae bacterium]